MRKFGERLLIVIALVIPLGGFMLLFGSLGFPYASEREEILLMLAAALATTVLLTAGWIAWRRIHGRSVKGPLLLGSWFAGACVVAALLTLAGVQFTGRRAGSAIFFVGMVGSTVLMVVFWLVALFVRVNVDWVRDERRRGGVFR